MIIDSNLLFTTIAGQAITSATTTTSTDTIDISPLTAPSVAGGVNTVRDIGGGEDLSLFMLLSTGSVTTVTGPTVRIDIQTADDTGFSVNAKIIVVSETVALPITTALAAAGQVLIALKLPSSNWRRYARAQIVTGGTITTASYTLIAGIAKDVGTWRAYADGITIQ